MNASVARAVLSLLLCASCANGPRLSASDAGDTGVQTTTDSAAQDSAAVSPDVALPSDCAPGAEFIYAIATGGNLLKFDPQTLRLTSLGRISCPGVNNEGINSMAVDRRAVAWINAVSSTNALMRMPIATMQCERVEIALPPTARMGMSFSTLSRGAANDALYFSPLTVDWLFRVDVATATAAPIGPFYATDAAAPYDGDCAWNDPMCSPHGAPDRNYDAELTGTSEARLFGFAAGRTPTEFIELDPRTGRIITQQPLPDVRAGGAWAMAHWGGAFWIFTDADRRANSAITRYVPETRELRVMVASTGFRIVGAGVSTCAPLRDPRHHG